MTFGEKLSRLRKQNGYTQKELADALGVSLRTITNYETGGRYPKQRAVYGRLSDILHVDKNFFLQESEEVPDYFNGYNASETFEQARRILAEIRNVFQGNNLKDEEKDELMRAILDAYWLAKEISRNQQNALLEENEESETNNF